LILRIQKKKEKTMFQINLKTLCAAIAVTALMSAVELNDDVLFGQV
jgi:hypothetical protein